MTEHKELTVTLDETDTGKKLSTLGRVVCRADFFVSEWLDKDQVRVAMLEPGYFRIKCGRMLTDQEVKGAIVKFVLANKDRKLSRGLDK